MILKSREKGCYLEDIAANTGCSVSTVQRSLKRQGPPARRRQGIRVSKLDDFKLHIDHLLTENVWNAEVIFAEIKERGYTGEVTILRNYIQPRRVMHPGKVTTRYETESGHQLQHDWGELMVEVGGELRKVYFSVNTLGYSRRFYAWAAFSNDAEHTYESLIRSFEWFGGVSAQVLVDNQKAAVLKHPANGQVQFNEGFLLLSQHYGFQPKACKPYRARTKGKTERMVRYVKENFFQRYRRFLGWTLSTHPFVFKGYRKLYLQEESSMESDRVGFVGGSVRILDKCDPPTVLKPLRYRDKSLMSTLRSPL